VEQQQLEGLKKHKSTEQANQGGGKCGGKSGWKKKKKNTTDSDGKKQKKPPASLSKVSKDLSCPVHGNHIWGGCALNPENKDNKELDKFRPKKQNKNSDRKETHNVEFAEEPLQNTNNTEVVNEVNMTDASDDNAIDKPTNAFESTGSFQATNSNLHHFDCSHLQEME